MGSNPPIIVTGNTPVVSVVVGNYENSPIYVYLPSLSGGQTVTIRVADDNIAPPRLVYVSTIDGTTFGDGSDTVVLTQPFQTFTTTSKNTSTWLKEVTVIQGQTLNTTLQDMFGYAANTSTFVTSSISTNTDFFVQGSSIFYGPLIGLLNASDFDALSTVNFSTGKLTTSSLYISESLATELITAQNLSVTSTLGISRASTLGFYGGSTFVSSIRLVDITNPSAFGSLTVNNSALVLSLGSSNYTYPTLEQSGFSNASTQIASAMPTSAFAEPISSLNTVLQAALQNANPAPGLSSYSTSIVAALSNVSGGSDTGVSHIISTFSYGMSSVSIAEGLSSLSTVTSLGLSSVNAVAGGVALSTAITESLAFLNPTTGVSSLSTTISLGLSSVVGDIPLSTFSTQVSEGFSTVAAFPGVLALCNVLQQGLSSVNVFPGLFEISSVFSYGVSSIDSAPGVSSFSTYLFTTISSFPSSSEISSLSTTVSDSLSSIAAEPGYAQLSTAVSLGLSSIGGSDISDYNTVIGNVLSTSRVSPGLSTLGPEIYTSLSTISDGPGVSSMVYNFSQSLSSITAASGFSSLVIVAQEGVSSLVGSGGLPLTYSTVSTILSTLTFIDWESGQLRPMSFSSKFLTVSGIPYPYTNQSLSLQNLSTQTMSVDAPITLVDSNAVYPSSIISPTVLFGFPTSYSYLDALTAVSVAKERGTYIKGETADYFLLYNGDVDVLPGTPNFQQYAFYNNEGMSSLSTTWGYGYIDVFPNDPLAVQSSILGGLSSYAFVEGLSSLATEFANKQANYGNVISTLNVYASTASIDYLVYGQPLISSLLVNTTIAPASSTFVCSFITRNANITGNYLVSTTSATDIYGTILTTSSISTGSFVYHGYLTASTLQAAAVVTSSVSTSAEFLVSSILLSNVVQTSVLYGSNGSLYFGATQVPTSAAPTFKPFVSVPTTLITNMYASTVFVSTAASSFTMDVQGNIAQGFFSSQINEFRVRSGLGPQNWAIASVGGITPSGNGGNISSLVVSGIPNRISPGNRTPSITAGSGYSFFQAGFSTLQGSTISMQWDGRKILMGGVDYVTGCNLRAYIAPGQFAVVPSVPANSNLNNMWTVSNCTLQTPFSRVRAVAFNGSQYIATGNATNSNESIKYSFDGMNWSDAQSGGWDTADGTQNGEGGGYSIAWNGYKWVCGGSNASASAVKYSEDGITWQDATNGVTTGLVNKLIFNGQVFVAGCSGFADCNLKYSYNGLDWNNCTWAACNIANDVQCTSLYATGNYTYASFYTTGTSNFCRSYNGINFDYRLPGGTFRYTVNDIFDGQLIESPAGITNDLTLKLQFTRNLSGRSNGNGADPVTVLDTNLTLNNAQAARHITYAAKSNVLPSAKLPNLEFYGSTFHNVFRSTNTIVGFANNGYGDDGNMQHMERQNYLIFNNTLQILGHLSTQIRIDAPGNENANAMVNTNRFPRATLDVVCTINVQSESMTRNMQVRPATQWASTLGPLDRRFDVYVNDSTFTTALAVGRGATSNDFMSTPQSFFDVNMASNSWTLFRDHITDDTTFGDIMTDISGVIATMPTVAGTASGTLTYYWRIDGSNYKATQAGDTYFTGQHPTNCKQITSANVNDHVGKLVSVTDEGYTLYTTGGQKITGKNALWITNTSPITDITTKDQDPNVFGVITNSFNTIANADNIYETYSGSKFNQQLFDRIMVNSIGEGAVWVTNINGAITNGDYLCSSEIPGYARRQDDDRMRNYTVAKATMSCDFNPSSFISTIQWSTDAQMSSVSSFVSCLAYVCEPIEWNASTFYKAFIGCTYHCA